MSDDRIRKLERLAAQGDPEAARTLAAIHKRLLPSVIIEFFHFRKRQPYWSVALRNTAPFTITSVENTIQDILARENKWWKSRDRVVFFDLDHRFKYVYRVLATEVGTCLEAIVVVTMSSADMNMKKFGLSPGYSIEWLSGG